MNFYYFAISLDSVNLTENEFTGYVLSGLSEIPGGIIVIPMLHFFGRRTVTCASFFLQATAALIAPFVRGNDQSVLNYFLKQMIPQIIFKKVT